MSLDDCMYLENLNEYIYDEKKIVTYRWLSLTLNVSSNIAKQMLYHYYDHHKNGSKDKLDIVATYLISGTQYDADREENVYKVSVVRDKDLEITKSRFINIFSLHLYSLQKAQLKDLHILYGTDYDKIKENVVHSTRNSSISCPSSLQPCKEIVTPRKEALKETKESNFINLETSASEDGPENKENKSISGNAVPKSKAKSSKSAIASMFANQAKKLEAENHVAKGDSNSKISAKTSNKKTITACPKGSVASFFTKGKGQTSKILKPEEKTSERCDLVTVEENNPPPETKLEETQVIHSPKLKISRKTDGPKIPKSKAKPQSKGKRKSSSTSNNDAKRRRILTLDSSSESSSDEEEMDLDECPMPCSPPRASAIHSDDEVIPPTPDDSSCTKVSKVHRKQKKLVDKTFMDEDGYLVTKKEFELVIDSDEENPIPTAPAQKTPPKVKAAMSVEKELRSPVQEVKKSPMKTKQVSIMNFFKKK